MQDDDKKRQADSMPIMRTPGGYERTMELDECGDRPFLTQWGNAVSCRRSGYATEDSYHLHGRKRKPKLDTRRGVRYVLMLEDLLVIKGEQIFIIFMTRT